MVVKQQGCVVLNKAVGYHPLHSEPFIPNSNCGMEILISHDVDLACVAGTIWALRWYDISLNMYLIRISI